MMTFEEWWKRNACKDILHCEKCKLVTNCATVERLCRDAWEAAQLQSLETNIDNVALDNLEKEEIKPVVKYHYPVAILYEGKVYGMDWDNDKLVQKAVRDATPKELKYNCVLNQEF